MREESAKLVLYKFWELRGTKHRLIAHQKRRRDFSVVMRLACVHIEHELTERALEPRQAFFQNHKTRAGKFCSSFEIHLAERFAEIEMLLWRKSSA